MAIEIRELVIRAVVPSHTSPVGPPGPEAQAASRKKERALVAATVREVLRILKRDRER